MSPNPPTLSSSSHEETERKDGVQRGPVLVSSWARVEGSACTHLSAPVPNVISRRKRREEAQVHEAAAHREVDRSLGDREQMEQ